MAGEITVKWTMVKELQSDKSFAVLTASQKLTRRDAAAVVPQGRINVADGQITVATATGPKVVATKDADLLVDAAAFEKAVDSRPGLLQGWTGTATSGVSLVRATQNSTNFTGAISLTRATPQVSWLPPRTRTTVDYNQSYGTVSQPGVATVKTNIFHADAERDHYFSPRLFVFGSTTFDHNFSQDLDLEQAYGGGVGISVVHSVKREFDLKGDVHYEKEAFVPGTNPSLNLFGSTFSEKLVQTLPRKLVLNEFGSISPAWNDLSAYSAHVNVNLGFPVYKGLGFSLGAVDDYLNNAPFGSKRNSTQFLTGLTYTIQPR